MCLCSRAYEIHVYVMVAVHGTLFKKLKVKVRGSKFQGSSSKLALYHLLIANCKLIIV